MGAKIESLVRGTTNFWKFVVKTTKNHYFCTLIGNNGPVAQLDRATDF